MDCASLPDLTVFLLWSVHLCFFPPIAIIGILRPCLLLVILFFSLFTLWSQLGLSPSLLSCWFCPPPIPAPSCSSADPSPCPPLPLHSVSGRASATSLSVVVLHFLFELVGASLLPLALLLRRGTICLHLLDLPALFPVTVVCFLPPHFPLPHLPLYLCFLTAASLGDPPAIIFARRTRWPSVPALPLPRLAYRSYLRCLTPFSSLFSYSFCSPHSRAWATRLLFSALICLGFAVYSGAH